MDKIYSAFISSTSKVTEYRKRASDALSNRNFYCYSMEHFTAHDFGQIKSHIRNSDFILLIMGTDYGTIDNKTGKSWTQLEFEFAREIEKPVLAVITPELRDAIDSGKGVDKLQKKFYKLISEDYDMYSRCIENSLPIEEILSQYISSANFAGWSRNEISGSELGKWRAENAAGDLNGTWYHFHYSESDRSYIRVGKIEIEQDFTPSGYGRAKFLGTNYGLDKDEDNKIELNSKGYPMADTSNSSTWNGEYSLDSKNSTKLVRKYSGIYSTEKQYSESNFTGQQDNTKSTRGVHDFYLDIDEMDEPLEFIRGEFHDIAPSIKQGLISAYRSKESRDKKLKAYLKKHKQIEE